MALPVDRLMGGRGLAFPVRDCRRYDRIMWPGLWRQAAGRVIPDKLGHSVREEAGNTSGKPAGALGETLAMENLWLWGVGFDPVFSTRFDLRLGARLAEVKTKDRTIVPRPRDEASVMDYQMAHQKVDLYIFCSVRHELGSTIVGMDRFVAGWVLGWASREDMRRLGHFKEKGKEYDGKVWPEDSWDLYHDELRPMSTLREALGPTSGS